MAETRSITSALACSHPLVGKGAVEFFPGGGQEQSFQDANAELAEAPAAISR